MKPSLEQSTLVSVQRLAGALIGAAAAALLLLIPANEHGLRLFAISRGLEVVALVLFMHGAAIRFWNYALHTGAIAAGVLIFVDRRGRMLLAGLLARRTRTNDSASRRRPLVE